MPAYRQRFQPLKRRAHAVRIAALDCEGVGDVGGFLCGAICDGSAVTFCTDRADMLAMLLSRDYAACLVFAHNLDYDLSLLCGPDLSAFDWLYADARLLTATHHDGQGHKWTLADSGNLFPGFSVHDLGQIVARPKLALSPALARRVKAGVAWRDLDLVERAELRAYNVRDAEIVYQAVAWLQEELSALGGELAPTIAGCTMDLFRRSYLSTSWDTPDIALNDWFRQAYYGARTEPYRVGLTMDVNGYDFTSLYPSVQATATFPHPAYIDVDLQPRGCAALDRREGMARATVDIPDDYLPVLPARRDRKLFFPTGRVTSTWPLVELRHALDHGVKLLALEWVVSSRVSFNPFVSYITDLFGRRLSYKRAQDTREKIFKLLLNAAYGRFGVRGDGTLQRLTALPDDPDWDQYAGGALKIYHGRPYVLVPIGVLEQPAYCCVPFAMQIAASARVRLHTTLSLAETSLVYCDTDSVFATTTLPTGEGLGELRQEFAFAHAEVYGAKEYVLHLPDRSKVEHVKGVPIHLRGDYLAGKTVQFASPVTVREALVSGDIPARWKMRAKRRGDVIPKRALVDPECSWTSYHQTRPWTWAELVHYPRLE